MHVLKDMNISITDCIVSGGDWNSIFDEKLDKSGGIVQGSNIVAEMTNIINDYDLHDIWRIQHNDMKRFTFRQKTPLIQSRLDYFLVSHPCLDFICNSDIVPSVWSDHSGIILNLKLFPEWPKGNGIWKFNVSLLENEDYMNKMNENLDNWDAVYANIKDSRKKWELIKYEIRRFSITFSKKIRSEQNICTGNLLKQINDLELKLSNNPSDLVKQNYEEAKNQLKLIEENEAKGSMIRSRAQFIEEGEKPTRYFFNLEKHNALKISIRKLILPGGTSTTNPEEILEYQRSFYQNLYTSRGLLSHLTNERNYFLDQNVKSLSDGNKELCEGKLSLNEIENTLKCFKLNKSPGNDGIPIEFYKVFWAKLGQNLLSCLNCCYDKGELTVSQRQAIISLIEKHGKDRLYIKNWRPISLLNVDYKIATKALALRVKKVLPYIIHTDQTGYVEGRQIFESIRTIQDLMEITKIFDMQGIMLMVDFEKAFDSIEWNFLILALKKFNFGEDFIRWIKLLYTNISSCLINNGTTTKYFSLTRGLRQGDPLSGYLFIIATELLAERIRQNKEVHGIKFGKNEIKLTQYVDDMTVFVRDKKSVEKVFIILNEFYQISGLKVNVDKTEGLWLGKDRKNTEKPFKIKWPNEPIKALGIFFSYDEKAAEIKKFQTKLDKLTKQLHWWKARDLSLFGRVLELSKLIAYQKFFGELTFYKCLTNG